MYSYKFIIDFSNATNMQLYVREKNNRWNEPIYNVACATKSIYFQTFMQLNAMPKISIKCLLPS